MADNLATAQTTVNAGDTRFSGSVPIGFVDGPGAAGNAGEINLTTFNSPAVELDTIGTISSATVQIQQQDVAVAQSSAQLLDNFATLSLFPVDADPENVSGSLTVDGNEFSAIYRGNLATTSATLETGGAPTFEGTVSFATVQINDLRADGFPVPNASVESTEISATVGDPAGVEFSTLTGSLSVSDNLIRGAATGSESVTALNLESGLSFLGRDSTGPLRTTLGFSSAEVDADLGMLTAQTANALPVLTEVDLNRVSASVQSLQSGTVTLDENRVRGSAIGNQSSADLTVAGSNSFVGSAAIGNIQLLEAGSGAVASVEDTVVEVTVGSPNADSRLTDATVSVTETEIGASATGNRTTAALDITGNSVDLGARQDGARRAGLETNAATSVTDILAGATVASIQLVEDGVVNATVDDATIRIFAGTGQIGMVNITDSSLDLTGSTIEAVAMAGSAGQSIAIRTNDLVGSAGVSNFQSFSGSVDATTTGFSLNINVGDGSAAPGVNVVDSSLTLENNLVRGLAFGNMADSAITIDASTATAPALEPAGPFLPGLISEIGYTGGSVDLQQSQAAYALNNLQSIDGSVSSTASLGSATVQANNALISSTLTNDSNVIVGAAFGNDALNAIDLDVGNLSLTSAGGAVASLSNIQTVPDGAGVSTTVADVGFLGRIVAFASSSTASVDNNVIQAQVTGNRASANGGLGNTLTVTGGNILVDSSTAYTGLQSDLDAGTLSADTPFALQNLQLFDGANVTAGINSGSAQLQVVGSVIQSTLSVDGTQILAGATVNQATNRVDFDDITTLEGAAGLQSLQSSSAASAANVTGATLEVDVNQAAGDVTNSTLNLNDNFIQASARSNVVGNRMNVDASNLVVPGNNGVGSTLDFDNELLTVEAALGLSSQQFTTDTTTAAITGLGLTTSVGGDLVDSTSRADGNIASASATANTASSVMNIASGNLSVDGGNHGPVGAVANVQVLSADVTAGIDTSASGDLILLTDITGDITRSTVSASGNTFQALAAGNRAFERDGNGGVVGNALNVSGGSISTPATRNLDALAMEFSGDLLSADLAFTVQSFQQSSANLIADQTQTGVRINRDGIVDSSSVFGDANTFIASAINNQAANSASLLNLNSLETTAGVQNFQHVIGTSGTTTSTLGNAFQEGIPPQTFAEGGSGSNFAGVLGFDVAIGAGQTATIDLSGFTPDARTALEAILTSPGIGFSIAGDTASFTNNTAGLVFLPFNDFTGLSYDAPTQTIAFNSFESAGVPGEDASPFVIASLNGTILDSTISVADNRFSSLAMANDAINRLAVDANQIVEAANLVDDAEARITFGGDITASADFGVSNIQRLDPDAEVTASGFGTVGIETADPGSSNVTRSSLLVTDNVVDVRAQGNRVINVLDLSATNLGSAGGDDGAATALASAQVGLSDVSATSGLLGFGTGAILDSTLEISGNESRATAVLNDATNRVDLSGSNLHSSPSGAVNAEASLNTTDAAVIADSALNNVQVVGAPVDPINVTASAESLLRNFDSLHVTTQGIDSSSALLTGNRTEANAVSNRAGNLLNIDASNLSVSGGVLNAQSSEAGVTASATSTVQFALNAAAEVVTGSTVDVSGNTTVATASGNRASNALNAFASAGYSGIAAAGATGSVGGPGFLDSSSNATFGVLNTQLNDEEGSISASIADARNEIALTGGAAAVTGSTLRASGNQMVAEASGNFARNDIRMSVRPTGNGSAALTSLQANLGSVTSTLVDSRNSINVTGGAGVAGNTASVSNNRGIARASGNTAVNRIVSGD